MGANNTNGNEVSAKKKNTRLQNRKNKAILQSEPVLSSEFINSDPLPRTVCLVLSIKPEFSSSF